VSTKSTKEYPSTRTLPPIMIRAGSRISIPQPPAREQVNCGGGRDMMSVTLSTTTKTLAGAGWWADTLGTL